jgi:hypothetical protein
MTQTAALVPYRLIRVLLLYFFLSLVRTGLRSCFKPVSIVRNDNISRPEGLHKQGTEFTYL